MKPTIRTHRSGDLGWIISKHGEIYSDEFGFDPNFEIHIAAKIVSFIEKSDAFNSLWLCELEGQRAGSIAISQLSDGKAFLNFVLVPKEFRGHGVARALMATALDHARKSNISIVRLETYNVLQSARALYKDLGFQLVQTQTGLTLFGQKLDQEFWELVL
jgi:GNAT superfamily N-acetyltransferase